MSGCIELFKKSDPDVLRINICHWRNDGEHKLRKEYVLMGDQWCCGWPCNERSVFFICRWVLFVAERCRKRAKAK
jgi:hypothetical protein